MNKKIISLLRIFAIIIVLLSGYLYIWLRTTPNKTSSTSGLGQLLYKLNVRRIPESTGGKLEKLDEQDKKDSEAMAVIMAKLPIRTDYFSITFSYKSGKFLVRPLKENQDISIEFNDWYKNSPYTSIPLSRFVVTMNK